MGTCDSFPEIYQKLVGLSLLQGFREAVAKRLGGTQGCTHITELAGVLPTVAIQAFAGEIVHLEPNSEKLPLQLDRCRALRLDGPVVARVLSALAQRPRKGRRRGRMKIHEYQGKDILRRYFVPVPRGEAAFSVDEAVAVAKRLGGPVWVVKAQIHAGGRGKGGGVKLARSLEEVRANAQAILGMQLVTHQTGPQGPAGAPPAISRKAPTSARNCTSAWWSIAATQKVCLMASSEGGMDIEEVAAHTPEKIHRVNHRSGRRSHGQDADTVARAIGIPEASLAQAGAHGAAGPVPGILGHRCLAGRDQSAGAHRRRSRGALDAKFNFDSNALFRHPELVALRDLDEEDPAEIAASKFDLSYIQLDGDIGCLVNGAGLAMATMDTIKLYGGTPANFLDVGGGATAEKVTEAFKIMLRSANLKAILVNIFGGIMKCDTIAEGVIAASRAVHLSVPLVVRMKGTNETLGRKLLADSGLPIISADTMAEAAQRVVAATQH
jgi:succinyl-CoA synthetase beta subunit